MVPPLRIEPRIYPYHGYVMPFNYRGFKIEFFYFNQFIKLKHSKFIILLFNRRCCDLIVI